MHLAKSALILTVLLLGFAATAGAQWVADSAGTDADSRTAAPVAAAPVHPSAQPHLALSIDGLWLTQWARGRESQIGWLAWNPAALTPPGFVSRPNAPQARGLRRMNHRFLPIPLRWEAHVPILGQRSSIALNPSIVLGRRLTFMPDLCRGSRTFGFALEMKIGLDQPGVPAVGAAADLPGMAIVSKLRGIFNRD